MRPGSQSWPARHQFRELATCPEHIGADVARVFRAPNLYTYTWVSHVASREQQKGSLSFFHLLVVTSAQQDTHGWGTIGQACAFCPDCPQSGTAELNSPNSEGPILTTFCCAICLPWFFRRPQSRPPCHATSLHYCAPGSPVSSPAKLDALFRGGLLSRSALMAALAAWTAASRVP